MHKRALFGVSTTWIRLLVITLIGILLTPLLFRHLQAEVLGVWYLFFTIATLINLSDLGIPIAFGRAVSYIWGGRTTSAGRALPAEAAFYRAIPVAELYGSALFASFLMALSVVVIAFPFLHVYLKHIVSASADQAGIIGALLLFLAGVVLNLIAAVPFACISGFGDVGVDNIARIVLQVLGLIATVILLPLFPDIRTLSAIYLLQGAVTLCVGHYLLNRRYGIPLFLSCGINKTLLGKLLSEALPVFVTRIGLWMIIESNLLIAGYFLNAASIPDYAILRQLVMTGMSIPNAIPITLAPYASAAHAGGDAERVRYLYLTAIRYSLVITVVWVVGLLLWTPQVLDLWVGPGHFLGYQVLVPVVVNCFFELHSSAHGFFTWSVGKWPFAPLMIVAGILNVALASVGCRFFSFPGLAWGTLLSQATTGYWYGVYYTLRLLNVAVRDYLRDIMLPIMTYLAVLLLAAGSLRLFGMPYPVPAGHVAPSFSSLFLSTATGIVITLLSATLLAWTIALREQDRAQLLALLRNSLHRGTPA